MRRIDLVGVMLLTGLAAVFIGGGIALIDADVVKGWEIALIAGVGAAMVAASHPRSTSTTPHDAAVHGAARPASQDETLRAARGDAKTTPLHQNFFDD